MKSMKNYNFSVTKPGCFCFEERTYFFQDSGFALPTEEELTLVGREKFDMIKTFDYSFETIYRYIIHTLESHIV